MKGDDVLSSLQVCGIRPGLSTGGAACFGSDVNGAGSS